MPLDGVRFTIQNAGWSALNPEKASSARKAMNEYRKKHPKCEITGSDKGVQIHHVIPVWANPDLADDPDNFIALSSKAHIHLIYGHAGNFRTRYVSNIKDIAEHTRRMKAFSKIEYRPQALSTHQTIWSKIKNLFKR